MITVPDFLKDLRGLSDSERLDFFKTPVFAVACKNSQTDAALWIAAQSEIIEIKAGLKAFGLSESDIEASMNQPETENQIKAAMDAAQKGRTK